MKDIIKEYCYQYQKNTAVNQFQEKKLEKKKSSNYINFINKQPIYLKIYFKIFGRKCNIYVKNSISDAPEK
jgi:hypothetical protein